MLSVNTFFVRSGLWTGKIDDGKRFLSLLKIGIQ